MDEAGGLIYLRNTMAKKKDKIANASKARVRVSPKKRTAAARRTSKGGAHAKRISVKEPPSRAFDAMKWCGILPELAGDSLTIQRQMRDEW